jgi:hypothetical protein
MMRLSRLNTEFQLRHKLKMLVIRVAGRREVPDVIKLHYYRFDFFGKHLGALFQQAMRGPSEWSVFDREMMASYVSSLNQCACSERGPTARSRRRSRARTSRRRC